MRIFCEYGDYPLRRACLPGTGCGRPRALGTTGAPAPLRYVFPERNFGSRGRRPYGDTPSALARGAAADGTFSVDCVRPDEGWDTGGRHGRDLVEGARTIAAVRPRAQRAVLDTNTRQVLDRLRLRLHPMRCRPAASGGRLRKWAKREAEIVRRQPRPARWGLGHRSCRWHASQRSESARRRHCRHRFWNGCKVARRPIPSTSGRASICGAS